MQCKNNTVRFILTVWERAAAIGGTPDAFVDVRFILTVWERAAAIGGTPDARSA